MYIDLSYDTRGHEHFAAYDADLVASQGQYDYLIKQVENQYSLGKAQISASMKNAKTAANASIKSAQIGANATIKATQIRADVDRYGIDVQAKTEADKLALATQEMYKIGIPGVLIEAWKTQKDYEIQKEGLALQVASLAAQYRQSPDKYWLSADFENALPALMNSASRAPGTAGGNLNGTTGSPSGTPKPQTLEGLLMQLGGGAAPGTAATDARDLSTPAGQGIVAGGTGGVTNPMGAAAGGDLYSQILAQTQGGAPTGGAAGTGTTANASGLMPNQSAQQQSVAQAMYSAGLQGVGGFDPDRMTQSQLDQWLQLLEQGGSSWDDPRIKQVMQAAVNNGFNLNQYNAWAARQPKEGEQWYQAQQEAAKNATANAGTTATPTGLDPREGTELAGVSAVMAAGLDPFVLMKMDPTQRDILLSGAARLGYDVPTEVWKAAQQLPGQGNPLAA